MNNKISLVCITYNTALETKAFIEKYTNFESIDCIVLVDNNSNEKNKKILREIESTKLTIIYNDENKGFDYANNVGLKYAKSLNNSEYIFIANTDIIFEEQTLLKLCDILSNDKIIGACAPSMVNTDGSRVMSARDTPTIRSMYRDCFYFLRRNFLKTKASKYSRVAYRNYEYVQAVNGGLMVFRKDALEKSGYFDQNIFMYFDEDALCVRMKKHGYRIAYINSETVIHNHNHIAPCISDKQRSMISLKSTVYYFKNYLNPNPFQYFLFLILIQFHKVELAIIRFIFKLTKRK